jgi:hypothetical protein
LVIWYRSDRYSVDSPLFAQKLHDLLTPHLPSVPSNTRKKPPQREDVPMRLPESLNSNIRVYKYTEGQHFGPHYDDSLKDATTGHTSEWTLLVCLSGVEDGVEGGEVCALPTSQLRKLTLPIKTLFHQDARSKSAPITPLLNRGTALLHRYDTQFAAATHGLTRFVGQPRTRMHAARRVTSPQRNQICSTFGPHVPVRTYSNCDN